MTWEPITIEELHALILPAENELSDDRDLIYIMKISRLITCPGRSKNTAYVGFGIENLLGAQFIFVPYSL
jgi:hypothetical protein